jgi:hypothetical protein
MFCLSRRHATLALPRPGSWISGCPGRMHRYCRCFPAESGRPALDPGEGDVCQNGSGTRTHHHYDGRWKGVEGRIPGGFRQHLRHGVLRNAIKLRPAHRRWACSVCGDRTLNADAVSGDEQHDGAWQRRKPNLRKAPFGFCQGSRQRGKKPTLSEPLTSGHAASKIFRTVTVRRRKCNLRRSAGTY